MCDPTPTPKEGGLLRRPEWGRAGCASVLMKSYTHFLAHFLLLLLKCLLKPEFHRNLWKCVPGISGRQLAKLSLLHGQFRKDVILCPGLRDTRERKPVSEGSSGRGKEGKPKGGGLAEGLTSAFCQIQLPEPALGRLINRLFI